MEETLRMINLELNANLDAEHALKLLYSLLADIDEQVVSGHLHPIRVARRKAILAELLTKNDIILKGGGVK
ncbi:hypothetical protein [Rufibacter ruber]|uniref:hypothetical protein n=1 Tax=Rufibacter ruber TaxID=1783499 RepID=UPI00082BB89F|nr:hypothetical protein [Rufibacter ruber]